VIFNEDKRGNRELLLSWFDLHGVFFSRMMKK